MANLPKYKEIIENERMETRSQIFGLPIGKVRK